MKIMAYINKEDLLGTINEVYERKYARCNWKPLYDLYRMCIRRINRAPIEDVVKVVRCKNCIYRDSEGCPLTYWNGDKLVSNVDDNDFCSGGKVE